MNTRTVIDQSALPRHEAVRLLQLVTGKPRADLIAGLDLDQAQLDRYLTAAARRMDGEPLQYIEGTASFGPIEVAVDPRVLIPRPETEQLWEKAMALLPASACTVVDLCTGSGCVALATKYARPDDRVVATDLSPDALLLARENARDLSLEVEFTKGDLFDALGEGLRGQIDLIVCNPPYVTQQDWADLPSEVRDHEPQMALVASEEGVAFYRRLATEGADWLRSGGAMVAEIGETQGEKVLSLFLDAGWRASVERDLNDRDRLVVARRTS